MIGRLFMVGEGKIFEAYADTHGQTRTHTDSTNTHGLKLGDKLGGFRYSGEGRFTWGVRDRQECPSYF